MQSNDMYFNPEKVLKEGFLFNFVTSQRGGGKTFSSMKFLIEKFLEDGSQFVYLRRRREEAKHAKTSLLSQLHSEGYFENNVFFVKGNNFYVDGKICGYSLAVSTALSVKSVSFSKVRYIVYDEFIAEDNKYLPNEVVQFLSVYETINRMRDTPVLFLANKSTNFNPYYAYLKVKSEGQEYCRYRSKSIMIHNYKNTVYNKAKKETKFGKLISETPYGSFLLDNETYQDKDDYVNNLNGYKKEEFLEIIYDGKKIMVYNVEVNNCAVLFFKMKESKSNVKSINFDKMLLENSSIEIARGNTYYKRILLYIEKQRVFFYDIPTKSLIESLIF